MPTKTIERPANPLKIAAAKTLGATSFCVEISVI
jgi:hypothetical protein